MKNRRRARFQRILGQWLEEKGIWFDNKGAHSVGHDGHLYIQLEGTLYAAVPVEVKTSTHEEIVLYARDFEQYQNYYNLWIGKKIRTLYAFRKMGEEEWRFEFIDKLKRTDSGHPKLEYNRMRPIDAIVKEVRAFATAAKEVGRNKKESKTGDSKKRRGKQN